MFNMKTVIFVRQKPEIAESVIRALKSRGYFLRDTFTSNSWEISFQQAISFDSLVIVDDSEAGVFLCQQLRASFHVPIVSLGTRSDAIGLAQMLNYGADDAISLPVHPGELAARLDAVLRRYEHHFLPYPRLSPRVQDLAPFL
jgi:DNA-binding response OmpR family regulator